MGGACSQIVQSVAQGAKRVFAWRASSAANQVLRCSAWRVAQSDAFLQQLASRASSSCAVGLQARPSLVTMRFLAWYPFVFFIAIRKSAAACRWHHWSVVDQSNCKTSREECIMNAGNVIVYNGRISAEPK